MLINFLVFCSNCFGLDYWLQYKTVARKFHTVPLIKPKTLNLWIVTAVIAINPCCIILGNSIKKTYVVFVMGGGQNRRD
jgi:hypothetical protein